MGDPIYCCQASNHVLSTCYSMKVIFFIDRVGKWLGIGTNTSKFCSESRKHLANVTVNLEFAGRVFKLALLQTEQQRRPATADAEGRL